MAVLANRVRVTTSTTGTGTITLGSAATTYQTFAEAGVSNGDVVRYLIEEGTNWEVGTGTYTATGTTLSRTVSESSNSGSAITLAGNATVSIVSAAEDVTSDVEITGGTIDNAVIGGTTAVAGTFTNVTSTGTLTYATLNDGTTSLTSTVAELNYSDGVTSNIQTQLDAKAPLASPAFTGTATGVNLTLSGDLTVNGTTTTLNTTNTVVSDNLLELNNGVSSNANDSGIVIERGSTGDNAFMGWDESADSFIVGTTTATGSSTGDLTITAAPLTVSALTASSGAFSGDVTFGDNDKAIFGAGNDLQIYHAGGTINHIFGLVGHSTYITGGTDLYLRGVNGEEGVTINGNGAVELFYDDAQKFATTSAGVNVTGSLDVTDAATTRTNLGVDAAGTDNSTDVTLAGSLDYLTLSGQQITLNSIDLTTDVTGALPIANGGTNATTAAAARTNLDVDQAGTAVAMAIALG